MEAKHNKELTMNIEENTKKTQVANKDYTELRVTNRSLKISYTAIVLIMAVFVFLRTNHNTFIDFSTAVCGSVFAGMAYRFIKTKQVTCLVIALMSFIAMIVGIVRFTIGF